MNGLDHGGSEPSPVVGDAHEPHSRGLYVRIVQGFRIEGILKVV